MNYLKNDLDGVNSMLNAWMKKQTFDKSLFTSDSYTYPKLYRQKNDNEPVRNIFLLTNIVCTLSI